MKTVFIVATKDRPSELHRMLHSLEGQFRQSDEIIIVDGSVKSAENPASAFPGLSMDYVRCIPPSAAKQRNVGIQRVPADADFVGFLDDDVVIESGAVEAMRLFWERASEDVAGAAFNMTNHPVLAGAGFKMSALAERLGLYSSRKGIVLPSGFQTMIGVVDEDMKVDWIPTTASVWRRKFVAPDSFDEWFNGYSYLEDLDFSFRIGKDHTLVVIAGARYEHLPAPSGRGNGFVFGRREVRNRVYFVKKNEELSLFRCYVTLTLRTLMSFWLFIRELNSYYLARAMGSFIELINPFRSIRPATSGEKPK